MNYTTIGILGGTFDPVHQGHLSIAEYLLTNCHLKEIQFIPCFQPPHRRTPQASAQHRLKMLNLALQNHPFLVVNDIDYQRPGPSYMVDTLAILRQQQPYISWCLILGMDAFLSLNQWRQWEMLLKLANIIVVNRPGYSLPNEVWQRNLLIETQINDAKELPRHLCGKVLFIDVPPSRISATDIRHYFNTLGQIDLPPAVYDYIQKNHLY